MVLSDAPAPQTVYKRILLWSRELYLHVQCGKKSSLKLLFPGLYSILLPGCSDSTSTSLRISTLQKTPSVLLDLYIPCNGVLSLKGNHTDFHDRTTQNKWTKNPSKKYWGLKMSTHFSTCLATAMGGFTWESPCCSQPWEIPWGSLLSLRWKLESLSLLWWG